MPRLKLLGKKEHYYNAETVMVLHIRGALAVFYYSFKVHGDFGSFCNFLPKYLLTNQTSSINIIS